MEKDKTPYERIAKAMVALRPEWNAKSIETFLIKNHSHRAARDLAIAAVIVATDSRTRTPNLLNQHGPWWEAVMVATGDAPRKLGITTRCPVHDYEETHNCGNCRSEYLITGNWPAGTQHQESRKT